MAEPTVIEGRYVVIEAGDGATPTEVFTPICGVNVSAFNHTVQSADRFIRDCAALTAVPKRRVVVNGEQWDITASGFFNLDNRATIDALVGIPNNYRVTVYQADGATEEGMYAGEFVMTAKNLGGPVADLATLELTLASNGAITWTDA